MPAYSYRAKSVPGKTIEGLIEAENRALALEKLARQGYFPIMVEEQAGEGEAEKGVWPARRISLKDLSLFTRQLSDLLESGVTLLRALEVAQRQSENKSLAGLIGDVKARVSGGKTLSEAMQGHPRAFSPLYVSLVHAGEMGGALSVVLSRLSELTEQDEELRSKIMAAMAYPLLIMFVGTGTVLFLVSFVVPRLAGMFSEMGQTLPLATRMIIGASRVLTGYWWIFAVVLIGGFVFVPSDGEKEKRKLFFDRIVLRLPLWGVLVKKVAIARFARTLSTLLSSGVPILDALRVVSHTLGHSVLRAQVMEAAKSVQHGAGLAEGLKSAVDFPPFIRNMIAVGEEGNILEKSLLKVATTYEREADRAAKTLTTLLEPLMILCVGAVIALIVVAMLLPVFQIPALVK